MAEGRVEDLYARIKERAITFRIRPGERINEGALARELDASRTPVREALNRLVAERLIDFRPGTGFFCRDLDPQSIYDLYELREAVEVAAVRHACTRASDKAIAAFSQEFHTSGLTYTGLTVGAVTERDEAFHLRIATLSGNTEAASQLARINERIRFIRWIDMTTRVGDTRNEHKAIVSALEARDAARASEVMRAHIVKRMDQIVAAVKEGYSSIYVTGPEEVFARIIEESDDT